MPDFGDYMDGITTLGSDEGLHSLQRTSPKGQEFVGRCIKCGGEDFPASAALQQCPNPAGMTEANAFNRIMTGKEDA